MRHTQAGFSILELVIIMAIIAILAVIPFYHWPGNTITLDAQAKEFVNDIRYAQSQSFAKSERYRIVRLSSTTYRILNNTGLPLTFPSGSTTATLNSGLSFGTWSNLTNNLIAFDGEGTPYLDSATPGTPLASGTVYSITISDGVNSKVIGISPITGRVYYL